MKSLFRDGDTILNLPRRRIENGYEERVVCGGRTFDDQCGTQNYEGPNLRIKYLTVAMRQAG